MERELPELYREVEVLLHLHALAQADVHFLGEEDGRAFLQGFRLVHGVVGVGHQRLDALAVVGIDRDADAAADHDFAAGQVAAAPKPIANPFGDLLDLDLAHDVGHQDQELVAAQARDGVGLAQALLEPRAGRGEELVTERVAEGIVHVS